MDRNQFDKTPKFPLETRWVAERISDGTVLSEPTFQAAARQCRGATLVRPDRGKDLVQSFSTCIGKIQRRVIPNRTQFLDEAREMAEKGVL